MNNFLTDAKLPTIQVCENDNVSFALILIRYVYLEITHLIGSA